MVAIIGTHLDRWDSVPYLSIIQVTMLKEYYTGCTIKTGSLIDDLNIVFVNVFSFSVAIYTEPAIKKIRENLARV